ncbi:MAG: hypothetical protein J6D26_01130 [Clostridia bacterium]|nr:hypothetical protein [Clostridia bacterium]
MAKEIVDAVRAAEQKAHDIKEAALSEAAEMAQKAKKDSSDLIADAKSRAESEAQRIIAEANQKADALLNSDSEDERLKSLKSDIASKSKEVSQKLIGLI